MASFFVERKECPACNSSAIEDVYSCRYIESPVRDYLDSFYQSQGKIEYDYLKDADYHLCNCSTCGALFQKWIPNDFLSDKLYDEWIDPDAAFQRHQQKNNLDYLGKKAGEIIQIIGYFNLPPHQLHLLDFGMGWCQWANMARAFGCNCSGSEISAERIEFAESQGLEVIPLEKLPDEHFDFINSEQVFEHLPNPLEILNILQKALKPHGLLRINVPDGSKIRRNIKKGNWTFPAEPNRVVNPISPLEHINCYSGYSMARMADATGLRIIKMPIPVQLKYNVNISGLSGMLKKIVRPFYTSYFPRGVCTYFEKP